MLRILHTNDFHGTLDDAREACLMELRDEVDLYLDAGDAIKAGNLAIPLREEDVWKRLARLRCDASALGNRESHVLERPFRAKIAGAMHPILCANVKRRDDADPPLPGSWTFERAGMRVGVLSVMVPMVTERMATKLASQFLWDEPLSCAAKLVESMRRKVDCLIALTHIGFKQDLALAERCPSLDLIVGGHSHTVLDQPVIVGSVAIVQAGSHGRFAGRIEWSDGVVRDYEFLKL